MYVKNSIQTKRRTELETDDAEIISLETCPYKSKRSLYILLGEFVVVRFIGLVHDESMHWGKYGECLSFGS